MNISTIGVASQFISNLRAPGARRGSRTILSTVARSWKIRRGKRCSLHYYKLKTESFYLRSGWLKIRVRRSTPDDLTEELKIVAGRCMDVTPGLVHQIRRLEDAKLFEFSTDHFDSDSHRLLPGDLALWHHYQRLDMRPLPASGTWRNNQVSNLDEVVLLDCECMKGGHCGLMRSCGSEGGAHC